MPQALSLLRAMLRSKLVPGVTSYSAAMSACEKRTHTGRLLEIRRCDQRVRDGQQWEQAVRLLERRIDNQRVRVGRQWEQAVRQLVRRMCNRRVRDGRHCEHVVKLQRFVCVIGAIRHRSVRDGLEFVAA